MKMDLFNPIKGNKLVANHGTNMPSTNIGYNKRYLKFLSNKGLSFNMIFNRKYTVLRGESSSGKTYISKVIELKDITNIRLDTDFSDVISVSAEYSYDELSIKIAASTNTLFIFDEHTVNRFNKLWGNNCRLLQDTLNYFLIISRDFKTNIPVACEAIMELEEVSNVVVLRKKHPTTYKLPTAAGLTTIISEDEKAGLDFAKLAYSTQAINCTSAEGNSKIVKLLEDLYNNLNLEGLDIIADGSVFGIFLEELSKYKNLKLSTPESLEFVLLHHPKLYVHVSEIMEGHPHTIPASFYSGEQFYTSLFKYALYKYDPSLVYDKSSLPTVITEGILDLLENYKGEIYD